MQKLNRRIPNLNALTFFECAGRHMSFSRAAAELHVTQGAVSRQIRLLEESLGTALFQRLHRAVAITPAGKRFHAAVSVALSHVQAATDDIATADNTTQLTLAATHAVSTFWLMPRIPRLRASFPDLDVQVLATDTELDDLADRFDIGFRYGDGRWPGFRAVPLGNCEVFPVCSPAYLATRGEIATPRDLLGEALLHQADQRPDWIDWPGWLTEQGVPGPYPRPALRVNSYPLLVQAAINGQGIALGWSHLVHEALQAGTLTIPLNTRITTRQGVYLAIPRGRELSAESAAVSEWLTREFKNTDMDKLH